MPRILVITEPVQKPDAGVMLDEQIAYPCAEVWERTRHVCTVRREE